MIESLLAALGARGQAPLAGYLARFLEEYAVRVTPLGLALAAGGLVVGLAWLRAAAPAPPWGPDRGRRLRLAAALGAGLAAAAYQAAVLGRIPREPDEATYLFEARLALRGCAAAPDPGPEIVALVELPFSTTRAGRWLGAFPPGWPLVLALGEALSQPWLVNPLLLVLNLGLVGAWVARRFGDETATLAVLLGALSPLVLVLHGTLMADGLGTALCLAALLAAEDGRPGRTGLFAGLAVATRPALGFFVAPLLAWTLRRPAPAGVAAALAGLAPGGALLLGWNALATGDPFTWTYALAAPPFGFTTVAYQGLTLRHDALAGAVGLGMNAAALGVDLLGLAGLAWLPLLAGLPALVRGGGPALAACGVLAAGHLAYFHPGIAYGPRFVLPALGPVLAAAALGFEALGARVGRGGAAGIPRVLAALAPAMILAWWLPASLQLARHAGTDPLPVAVARARRPADATLVFVPAVGYPERPLDRAFLGELDPFWTAPVVYLRDPGTPEARARVAARLGRRPWVLAWP